MNPRDTVLRLGRSHPLLAFWLAGLARVWLDAELLDVALRLFPEECAAA